MNISIYNDKTKLPPKVSAHSSRGDICNNLSEVVFTMDQILGNDPTQLPVYIVRNLQDQPKTSRIYNPVLSNNEDITAWKKLALLAFVGKSRGHL